MATFLCMKLYQWLGSHRFNLNTRSPILGFYTFCSNVISLFCGFNSVLTRDFLTISYFALTQSEKTEFSITVQNSFLKPLQHWRLNSKIKCTISSFFTSFLWCEWECGKCKKPKNVFCCSLYLRTSSLQKSL